MHCSCFLIHPLYILYVIFICFCIYLLVYLIHPFSILCFTIVSFSIPFSKQIMKVLLFYLFTCTAKVLFINYYCKKKYKHKKDDWIKTSLYGAVAWMYLAILIVYLAQYKPMITPEEKESVDDGKK